MNLNNELGFFQKLLLDIMTRRVIFRKFEAELKKTNLTEYNNYMVRFVWYGYVISQLSDCRKFFDRDVRTHNFQFVVEYLKNVSLKNRHTELFDQWKNEKLEVVINKYMLHADQRASEMKTEVHLATLDTFIDDLKTYLEDVVDDLNNNYQCISSLGTTDFLLEREHEVKVFFDEIRKNPLR